MTYTPSVPQANQTIAATQSPINANFQYLNTALQYEHNFNNVLAGVQLGSHQSCSMPNLGGLPFLGTLINGVYYVNGSQARYNNGTNDYQLSIWTQVLTGTYTTPSGSGSSTIVTLPPNVFGVIYFYATVFGTNTAAMSGQFATNGTQTVAFSNTTTASIDAPVVLVSSGGSLNLLGSAQSSSVQGKTYSYFITYRPA